MTDTPPHLCVGPDCWTCGEPTEIRQLRQHDVLSALHQLAQNHPGADHHRQARAAMDALRPTLMRWLHAEADLRETRQQLDARDAEIDQLRAERDQFADRVDTLTAVCKSNRLAHRTAVEECERLQAALNAVDRLHQPKDHAGWRICIGCSRLGHYFETWPCATAKAINPAAAPTT